MHSIVIKFFFFFFFSYNLFAASGEADKYEVTMKKVELCTSSSCSSPTVVATGSQSVNVASLSAGAEAAAFGSTSGLPIGTSFTHLRVTLNRSFTIEGEVNVSGDNWCSTDSSAAGTATALHRGTLKTDNSPTDGTDQTLYLADAATNYGDGNDITISYASPSSAVSITIGSPSSSEVQLIYKLTSTYIAGPIAPKIKVSFDTSTALGAGISDSKCEMWPQEPIVTISLTE
ncbi:MAG: hypothetical protein CFH19_00280 [Alphaproteobacteria bacterium MarineAlpha5_Bin9]|nr:MAG: hypothetical protein CFH19_00280 [Alphaproteobacteria bacterium MarineAlpha5_Bin9]|tara:strand:+ start:3612 stop:4304 length:693 start_codon:yes stop_codon:yes gene_type:complete